MNTEFSHLISYDIFPIKWEGKYLIYAPISDSCFICDIEDAKEMERVIANRELKGSPYEEVLSPLMDDSTSHEFAVASHHDLTNISIFPTWSCNFNCTYCYASKNHTKGDIDTKTAFSALDYFFGLNADPVYLQILGGGEPFIRWNIVKEIVEYARNIEKSLGRELTISIATNGSNISEEIITDIKKYDIRLSYSFDILKDIQDIQRGRYELVSRNLKKLLEENLGDRIFVRTVVTPQSVKMLNEIVDEVCREYHGICGVIAEPVMGEDNFSSIKDYQDFCDAFYDHFSSARTKALAKGLEFTTMTLRNIDFTIDRSCEGDFCVTPNGSITVCHRLASPWHSSAQPNPFVYGQIASGRVEIDDNKYNSLTHESVRNRRECSDCFAKYNCGGGCIARNANETKESKKYFCDLTRKLLFDELLRRYNDYE